MKKSKNLQPPLRSRKKYPSANDKETNIFLLFCKYRKQRSGNLAFTAAQSLSPVKGPDSLSSIINFLN